MWLYVDELVAVDKKIKTLTKELKATLPVPATVRKSNADRQLEAAS